jgi:hypothetical protein
MLSHNERVSSGLKVMRRKSVDDFCDAGDAKRIQQMGCRKPIK